MMIHNQPSLLQADQLRLKIKLPAFWNYDRGRGLLSSDTVADRFEQMNRSTRFTKRRWSAFNTSMRRETTGGAIEHSKSGSECKELGRPLRFFW